MSASDRRPERTAHRIYRALAVLYPRRLRRGYGREMEEAFQDQARAAFHGGGRKALAALLVRTAWGALDARWRGDPVSRDGIRTGGGAVGWTTELRHAARALAKSPGFLTVSALTLALGVGAFASVLGSVAGVLVSPMPYDAPEGLHWVWRDYWGTFPRGWLGGPDVARLREQENVFEDVIAFRTGRVNLSGASEIEPRVVRATQASPGFLELLGVSTRLGPGFTRVAHAPEAPDEAVLGHDLWRASFGSDPSVIGRDVHLDGDAYRIVGVLPEGFDFVVHSSLGDPESADLYVPLPTDLAQASPNSGSFAGLARVRPGVSDAQVEAALARVAGSLDAEFFGNRGFRLWRVPMREDLVGDARLPLLAVLGASGILLLILGANLASLFLSRARERKHHAAVRAALGASRLALLRTAAAEAVVVTGVGLGGGLLVAVWGSRALATAARSTLPRSAELGFDAWTAVGAAAAALVLASLAMTGPALRWSATAPSRSLRDGGPGRSAAAGGRARSVLVAVQLALALTLVVGSGLLARSLASLLREDPGFDVVDALTLRVSFRGASYGDSASIVDAQRRLLDRVSALPGVAAAGITDALPLGLETNQSPVTFPGAPHVPDEGEGISDLADVFSITPGYAEAVGLRILGGRALRPSDETAPLGALIDDVVAARWFPQGGAVGATMLYGGGTLTVVGVVDQARFYDVFRDDRGQVYLPRAYAVQREAWLAVRVATGNPLDLLPAVRAALGEIDPTLPVAEVRTLEAIVRAALGGERLNLTLVGAFALAALVLAGLGLYGVVNGSVLQRRREIGIRMAVGAEPARVVRMIVGQGARLVAAGTLVGLAGAWVAGRLLASLLHGVAPFDPATYVGAAALLGLLALLATWVPARRATRIRPLETLGSE